MDKLNLNLIKEKLLKKDTMMILILTGILCLVIAWPVKEKEEDNSNATALWDRNGATMKKNLKEEAESEEAEEISEGIDEQVLQEEYRVEKMEQRLEEMLSLIQGVGKVKVMITMADKGEKIVEKDIPLERSNIVENDSAGGNRSTNEMYSQEETVYFTGSDGEKIPYVVKENIARVEGVSVVAQGGDREQVQKNITEIIQALFGIEEHKIKVVKMKQQE